MFILIMGKVRSLKVIFHAYEKYVTSIQIKRLYIPLLLVLSNLKGVRNKGVHDKHICINYSN